MGGSTLVVGGDSRYRKKRWKIGFLFKEEMKEYFVNPSLHLRKRKTFLKKKITAPLPSLRQRTPSFYLSAGLMSFFKKSERRKGQERALATAFLNFVASNSQEGSPARSFSNLIFILFFFLCGKKSFIKIIKYRLIL